MSPTLTTSERMLDRIRKELLGRYFSNRSELRHMAERAGFNFVPVEFTVLQDCEAVVSLRPKIGETERAEFRVLATRPVPWQPYRIIEVGAA